jgi:cysteine desulfurase family protein (TIGR01976 family)
MPELDVDRVRAEFPALSGSWTFFDNAGGSQVLARVADRVRDYMLSTSVQLGASYATSREATARVDAAARATAAFVGARDEHEIVIGSSTTQLLSNLALAMREQIAAGDEIIVTTCDHESNIGPWRRLAAERSAVIKEWRIDAGTLRLEAHDLETLLSDRTRLVCFTQASNVLGNLHDVAALTRVVHARKDAKVCVDGVAYAPHRKIDVAAWDVDYYAFSFYKVYGPHLAMLYGKRAHLDALPCIHHDFIGRDIVPYKLQPGNVCFELCHGLGGIYDYFDSLGGAARAFDAIGAHEERLAARLLDFLRDARGVRIHGDPSSDRARRVPTISFSIESRHSRDVVEAIDLEHIGIRWGDFYARRLIDELGLRAQGGVVRVSMVHYNTLAEVDRLVDALGKVLRCQG